VTISRATIEHFKSNALGALPTDTFCERVNEFFENDSSSAEHEQEKEEHGKHRKSQDERVLASST
jgi:hypothetical protein